MPDIEKLNILIHGILNDETLKPVIDAKGNVVTTFCNVALNRVLNAFDYHGFDGKLADEICEYLNWKEDKKKENPKEWNQVSSKEAQSKANLGYVAIATHPYANHGHVAVIAPGQEVFSGHWGVFVPFCANVGKTVGLVSANFAFPIVETPPKYHLLCLT